MKKARREREGSQQRSEHPLESVVRRELRGLKSESPVAGTLKELAFSLAKRIDDPASRAVAASTASKEMREILGALTTEAGDDDALDALIAAFSGPPQLSAPLVDPAAS